MYFFMDNPLPDMTLIVCAIVQMPPNALTHVMINTESKPGSLSSAHIWIPFVISRRDVDKAHNSTFVLMLLFNMAERQANSVMYPPSFNIFFTDIMRELSKISVKLSLNKLCVLQTASDLASVDTATDAATDSVTEEVSDVMTDGVEAFIRNLLNTYAAARASAIGRYIARSMVNVLMLAKTGICNM